MWSLQTQDPQREERLQTAPGSAPVHSSGCAFHRHFKRQTKTKAVRYIRLAVAGGGAIFSVSPNGSRSSQDQESSFFFSFFFLHPKQGALSQVNPHSYRQAILWSVRWGRPPKGLWWFYPLKEGGGCEEESWRGSRVVASPL